MSSTAVGGASWQAPKGKYLLLNNFPFVLHSSGLSWALTALIRFKTHRAQEEMTSNQSLCKLPIQTPDYSMLFKFRGFSNDGVTNWWFLLVMLRPWYVKDFPMKYDVFIWIREKILSTSRSQITPHGNKTFTEPYYRNPIADYLLNCFSRCHCTNTTAPGLHTGVNCFYRVYYVTLQLHRSNTPSLAR